MLLERGVNYWWYSHDAIEVKLAKTALNVLGTIYAGALAWNYTGGMAIGPGNQTAMTILKGTFLTAA